MRRVLVIDRDLTLLECGIHEAKFSVSHPLLDRLGDFHSTASRLMAVIAAALESLQAAEPIDVPNWILMNQPPKSPRRWQR